AGGVAQTAARRAGHAPEEPIARGMPEPVADVLEAGDIEAHDRDRGAAFPRPRQPFRDALMKQRPVGQVSEHVVVGKVQDLLLPPLELADVGVEDRRSLLIPMLVDQYPSIAVELTLEHAV